MSDNTITFHAPEPEQVDQPAEVKPEPKPEPERKRAQKPSADKYTPFSW